MKKNLQELVAVYSRERIRWDETAILECESCEPINSEPASAPVATLDEINDSLLGISRGGLQFLEIASKPSRAITVKAFSCQPDELVRGLTYRFYGKWNEHERHGKQFISEYYQMIQPHGRDGVLRYLTTTCAGCGVGHATAKALYEKFQSNAVKILRERPEVAVAAVGMPHFTVEKAMAASVVLREHAALESVSIDLIDLLGGRGFPRDTAKKLIMEFGPAAADLLKKNPFLMRRIYPGRFLQTDKLYLDLGGNPAAMKRQALAAWYSMARDNDGHTWHRAEDVANGIAGRVGGTNTDPIRAMKLAKRARLVSVTSNGDGRPWLADYRRAENESTIAECVRTMLAAPNQWPEVAGLDISDHQKAELAKALASPIGCFGGSPGTGKTYSAARLIDRIASLCGRENIAVCAPTGKAAVRITEALESYGVGIQATTIHRLLGVQSVSSGDGWAFTHNEENPLEQKYFALDESSMPDVDIMASFMRAMPLGSHLIMVGDINQLPPVGHGAPLRDLIAAGIPSGSLTEIKRNSGSIVRICAAIRDGQRWQYDSVLDPDAGQNMILCECRSNTESLEKIVETCHKLRTIGIDPVWDTQVLVSVNGKSELSRTAVNKRLQAELNPDGLRADGCPFRVGDKIIRIKRNTLMPCAEHANEDENQDADNGKVLVCNGEQGRVVGVEPKRAFARFTGPNRLIVIPFGKQSDDEGDDDNDDDNKTNTGCDFDLGYACTVHKYQGSEVKVILWGLDDSGGAMRLGCRELFFTGISRAKYFEIHFGKKNTADCMCMRRSIMRRKTFLKERILEVVK